MHPIDVMFMHIWDNYNAPQRPANEPIAKKTWDRIAPQMAEVVRAIKEQIRNVQ